MEDGEGDMVDGVPSEIDWQVDLHVDSVEDWVGDMLDRVTGSGED